MIRACEKTGISSIQLEKLVDDIEAELQQRAMREVPSQEIGELVLQNLRQVSEVAYIRFASVYRKFQGIRDFVDTLDRLQGRLPNDFDATSDEISITLDLPTVDSNSVMLGQPPNANRLN
jgi:transcriptional repressor NrdR